MLQNSKITIEGKQLKSVYAVYVIELTHLNETYYYVGQTGDAHYIAARPPFNRIGGHLENTKRSTQNQLYTFIINKLAIHSPSDASDYTRADKARVESFLSESQITTMHICPLVEFTHMLAEDEHRNRRHLVLEFEKQVIHLLQKAGKNLINRSRHLPRQNEGSMFPDKYEAVKIDFRL